MHAEQAVFTSLARGGQAGYHLVSRSPRVTDAEARMIAAWSPSHGALIADEANPASLSFYPLGEGRYALARTCQGPPEYSGRGGRQLYTHTLIFDEAVLAASGYQLVALYRAAVALGHFRYRHDPEPVLAPAPLISTYRPPSPRDCEDLAAALGLADVGAIRDRLARGETVRLHHPGDRIELAECLLGLVPRESVRHLSVSTSLQPSASRPFRLCLLP